MRLSSYQFQRVWQAAFASEVFNKGPLTKFSQFGVAQVSNQFPPCCIADFQSADRPNLWTREMVRTARRLEALRYSRLETCATTLSTGCSITNLVEGAVVQFLCSVV